MSNVAQILLLVILLPFLCILLKAFFPQDAIQFIWNLLDEIPFLGKLFDEVQNVLTASRNPGMLSYLEGVLEIVGAFAMESLVLGMCVYLMKTIGTMLSIRGIPILQTILGIFLGCFILRYLDTQEIQPYYFACILIILNVLLTCFATIDLLWKKLVAIFIGLGFESIVVGFGSAYLSVLVLIFSGRITDPAAAVNAVLLTVVPLILTLIIDYLLFSPGKK